MSILKSKIIRNFVNTIYLFGLNASSEVRQIIINYLEKVFNYKLDNETKDILLNDRLSLEEINLFFRKYKYFRRHSAKRCCRGPQKPSDEHCFQPG